MAWSHATFPLLLAQIGAREKSAAPAAEPARSNPAAPAAEPARSNPAAPATKTAQPAAAPPADSMLPMLITFAPLILLFYFLAIRPQQQQERKRRHMVEALKKNDKVLTSAGIYGTVVSVDTDSDKVVLRVDDEKQVRFTFSKASIVRVIEPPLDKAAPASA